MDFPLLLDKFARAIEQRDAAGLARLFTADGVYDDYFFGASKPGHAGIGETVEHFYAGGTNYRWEFFSPLASASLGYASYRFSYDSILPEATGNKSPQFLPFNKPVLRLSEPPDLHDELAALGTAQAPRVSAQGNYWPGERK